MKVLVKKEYPEYRPSEPGVYKVDGADGDVYQVEWEPSIGKWITNIGSMLPIKFFYEESDAYIPKGKGYIELEEKFDLLIIKYASLENRHIAAVDFQKELENRIVNLELEKATTPLSPSVDLENKVDTLHSVINTLVEHIIDPNYNPNMHPTMNNIKMKLNELNEPFNKIYL